MKRKLILSILCLFVLTACALRPVIEPPAVPDDPRLEQTYRIGVGDQLSVQVWRNPELSAGVPVRPDGQVSVPLVGDVLAAGRTAEELAEQITQELENYIRSPKVTVIITGPTSAAYIHSVRISGAVGRPAALPYGNGMTVFDLVMAAGGPTPFANLGKAKLVRTVNGEQKSYPIYLDEIIEQGNLRTNYLLSPGDMIAVPEKLF